MNARLKTAVHVGSLLAPLNYEYQRKKQCYIYVTHDMVGDTDTNG